MIKVNLDKCLEWIYIFIHMFVIDKHNFKICEILCIFQTVVYMNYKLI